MPARHLILGRQGEDLAFEYLQNHSYQILERNWHAGNGELDFICQKQDLLVFVEVKTRTRGAMNAPFQGLTKRKCHNLAQAASEYLSLHQSWDRPCRFDLLAIVTKNTQYFQLQHTKNIFEITDENWQPW